MKPSLNKAPSVQAFRSFKYLASEPSKSNLALSSDAGRAPAFIAGHLEMSKVVRSRQYMKALPSTCASRDLKGQCLIGYLHLEGATLDRLFTSENFGSGRSLIGLGLHGDENRWWHV
jgi:hypothetical protein